MSDSNEQNTTASECCTTEQKEVCCAPSEKEACCAPEAGNRVPSCGC